MADAVSPRRMMPNTAVRGYRKNIVAIDQQEQLDMKLSRSTVWALAAIVATVAGASVTFLMSGQAQTFGYIVVSMGFAAFAVIFSNIGEKDKNNW